MLTISLAPALAAVVFQTTGEASASHRTVAVEEARSGIVVDGRLDEDAWRAASRIELPYEVRPRENARAPVDTECHAVFGARTLYLGCGAHDAPADVRAWFADRDGIGAHDRIVIFLDPFADARRAFSFGVNALGVQEDGVYDGVTGQVDLSWDAIWHSAGRVTDDGYVVEVGIPFSSLRFPAAGAEAWTFFVERRWPRSQSVVLRSTPLDHSNACVLCQADTLVGLSDAEPGSGVLVAPTLTAQRTDRPAAFPGPLASGSPAADVGGSGRARLTETLTLSAAVNPDFSQVEADAAQLDVNTQFSLFFPEKRPFFLEGTEVFATPLRAAFTRNVADPVAGASLTGKLGRTALATLVARDASTAVLVPANQGSTVLGLDRASTDVLQRVRRDVGGSGTLGGLYTGRFAGPYRNQVVGGDAFLRLTPLVRATAQYLRSFTRDVDRIGAVTGRADRVFDGDAAHLKVQRSDWFTRRSWFGTVQLTQKSPDFRADAGFEPQVDVRVVEADAAWNTWSDGSAWFTRLNYWLGGHHSETLAGRLNSREAWAWFSYEGPRQTFFWIWPRWGERFFAGRTFSTSYWEFSLSTQPRDALSVGMTVKLGDEIDFANARQGEVTTLSPSASVRLGRHVDLELQHRLQRLNTAGDRVFTANLSQLRAVYNHSARSFGRAVVQLRHTDRVPGRYVEVVDRRTTSILTQLLLSYRLTAQTGLFAGYSDHSLGLAPEDDPVIPLTRTDRTFFVKLAYAWQP